MYTFLYANREIRIETESSLFSPKEADKGTLAMLKFVEFHADDKVLDLGCGCGIVSLAAAASGVQPSNLVLTDIDPTAVRVASKNLNNNGYEGAICVVGDGLSQVPGSDFDLILSNPPYHTDFKVAKTFIEKGFNRLKIGGKMFMVTKRKDWYKNKLISIFGGVRIYEENGYYVFEAQKRATSYATKRK
ncbi:MAG: methyltransferase [Clostridiales bacterium]|nr:methyltransferase [Candidatus Scatonaster coprocaballi]